MRIEGTAGFAKEAKSAWGVRTQVVEYNNKQTKCRYAVLKVALHRTQNSLIHVHFSHPSSLPSTPTLPLRRKASQSFWPRPRPILLNLGCARETGTHDLIVLVKIKIKLAHVPFRRRRRRVPPCGWCGGVSGLSTKLGGEGGGSVNWGCPCDGDGCGCPVERGGLNAFEVRVRGR
ncbi:uncharacterized protein BKA78DRAFT_61389 [Phyllosticta capitalensis]|uniref:uncharacterized protein n=1 Tax=Phyllosticta capitalensis TaxID=121624 RepID=UPI0031304070